MNDRGGALRLLPMLALLGMVGTPEPSPLVRIPHREPPLPKPEPEPWRPADIIIGPVPRGQRFAVPVIDRSELEAKRAQYAQEHIDYMVARRKPRAVEPKPEVERKPKAERRARRRKRRQKGRR